MGAVTVNCGWLSGVAFESTVDGFRILMDGSPEFGGEDRGPKPKPLILSALAGCTGIDVVLILKKMKVEFSFFNIEVSAELSQAEPRIFEKIHLIYQFRKGEIADYEKVQKAVSLSQERYCGVSAMLRKAAEISYEIQYLD